MDKDGNNLSLYEVLKDEHTNVGKEVENKLLFKKIEKVLKNDLPEREQQIIIKRFGLLGEIPKTQIELAEEMNISRSYISRIEKKALQTIKQKIKL